MNTEATGLPPLWWYSFTTALAMYAAHLIVWGLL